MHRRVAWTLYVGLIVSVLASTGWSQPPPKKLAFLVGVSKYQKDGLADLNFADDDIRELGQVLKEKLAFDVDLLLGSQSTLQAVNSRFARFIGRTRVELGKEDIVLVAFSGHGLQKEVMRDGKTVTEAFFCPYDANKFDNDSLLSVNAVILALEQQSGSSQNLLVVDACRDDPTRSARGSKGIDGSTVKELPPKLSVLFTCSANQRSFESRAVKHGVFSHMLLEGLRGESANKRGEITWMTLASHVTTEVPLQLPLLVPGIEEAQRPNLIGNLDRNPVLGVIELARIERPPPVTPPRATPTPPAEPAAPPPARAGETITNTVGMKLTLIPAGEFMMGSPAGETGRSDDEGPAHRVRITRPFYLGTSEVTLSQFLQFYHAANYETRWKSQGDAWGVGLKPQGGKLGLDFGEQYVPWSWGHPNQTNDHPVVNVSWKDAVAFCEWLSQKERKVYRLPTEAEWEYACRAGKTTRFHNGDDEEQLIAVGNVADASLRDSYDASYGVKGRDGYPFTAPVGRFEPNAFGLYDMHGNAWEWCSDWYGKDYYAQSPTDDPQGPTAGSSRVIRGGGWNFYPVDCRSASRRYFGPSYRSLSSGFRVACER